MKKLLAFAAGVMALAPALLQPSAAQPAQSVIMLPRIIVLPGQSVTLPVSLSAPAPAGGVTVILNSSDTFFATVPAGVFIAAGQTAPAVQPQVTGVYPGFVVISGTAPNYQPGATEVPVSSFLFPDVSYLPVTAGTTRTFTVQIPQPTPSGGVTLNISSDTPSVATVPSTVVVPPGVDTATIPVTGVTTGFAFITVSASGYEAAFVQAQVVAFPLILLPTDFTVGLGQTKPYPINLSSPAPSGGVNISLAFASSQVNISPNIVFIPAGATSPITQPSITGLDVAFLSDVTATSPLYFSDTRTVQVVATLTFTPQVLTLATPTNSTLTLGLSGPAPASGLNIQLSSSNPSVATVPGSIDFPPGATSVSVPVTGLAVGTTVIRAHYQQLEASTLPSILDATAIVIINAGTIILPSGVTVGMGQSTPFNVTLPAAAPAGGVTVTLSSTDTSKLTISPTSVFIAAGATTPASQPSVTGVSPTTPSASINASAPGYSSASQAVVVTASVAFSPPSLTFTGFGTQNLTLTLSAPAPAAGLTVNLSSTDTAVATVPLTAIFTSGSTTATVPVTAVGAGSAVIHAIGSGIPDATASIVVNLGTINLPASPTVPLGQQATFAISLAAPAPAGGITLTLTSSDTSKVTISPGSVFIAAGATTPASQPQVTGVNFTLPSATITAGAAGFGTATRAVVVTATISLTPGSLNVTVGSSGNLTLTLSGPAPAGGVTVTTTSSEPTIASVPSSVLIPAGGTTVAVPVTGVATGGPVTITAAVAPLTSATASVTVIPVPLIILPSGTTVGLGLSTPFPVTLQSPAPAGGVTVNLASTDTSKLTISTGSVFVAAGATTPATQPQVTGVNFTLPSASITAGAVGYTAASQAVVVTASIALAPASQTINTFTPGSLTLTLSGPAPAGGLTASVGSSNTSIATVPSSVLIPAGGTSVNIPVTGVAVGGPVTLTATVTGLTPATASVTVAPLPTITLPTGTTVAMGQSVPFAVTLPQPAGNGVTITLTSSDPSKVTISPGTVVIAPGASAPATQPVVTGVSVLAPSASITATAPGYSSASQAVAVTATVSFSPASLTLSGPTTQNITLNLSAPAPAGGLTINLSSSNTAVATVPATVNFAAGATTANVVVTSIAPGSAVLHASALPGIPDATASVTVNSGLINLPSNATVGLGQTAAFPITLGAPAPANGITITLTSSDPSKVTISPASVFIAPGATTPATQPQVTGLNFALPSATISAGAASFVAASAAVQVTASLSFSPATLTLTGPANQSLTLNLSGPAPAGGVTIAVSSSNSAVVTVPASVTIPQNATSTIVQVTSLNSGSAVIHASFLPVLTDVTASIAVNPGTIVLPTNPSVALGQQVNFPVSLGAPAPSGGVTVTLTSSDPSRVTISPATVVIPAEATTPATQPRITGVSPLGPSPVISASATGFTTATRTVLVTASVALAPQALTIRATATDTLRLILSAPAPAGGLTVNLSSGNTNVATVPSSVTFPAGSTAVNVTVTAVGPGDAVIHASLPPGISDATANVNVPAPPRLEITSACPVSPAPLGAPYSHALTATGGDGGFVWSISVGSLPSGLVLRGNQIQGAPDGATGTSRFTIQVSSGEQTANQTCSLTVTPPRLQITSACPGDGTQGVAYSPFTLTASGGAGPGTFTFSITGGSLPAGLRLTGNTISGTPQGPPGASPFTIQVASGQDTASRSCSINIAPPPLAISGTCPASATVGTAVSVPVTATGGRTPYSFNFTGSPFLSFQNGVVSGTPTEAGTGTFRITVSDSAQSPTDTLSCTFPINPAPVRLEIRATCPAASIQVGTRFSVPLSGFGGTAPYTWSLSGESFMSLNQTTGESVTLSGTPTAAGTFPFTVTLSDSVGSAVATFTCTLTVIPALQVTSSGCPASPLAFQSAISVTGTATGGVPPYSWSLAGPSFLSLSPATGATTTVSGRATVVGQASFTVTLRDDGNTTPVTFSCSFVVSPPVIPPITITGTPGTNILTPIPTGMTLSSPAAVDLRGMVQLTFIPSASNPIDNPQVHFSDPCLRLCSFTIPAGSTTIPFPNVELGTVAGTIRLEVVQLLAGDLNVLPAARPTRDITVAAQRPVITAMTFENESPNGFDIVLSGFSTPRDMSTVAITFGPRTGSTLEGDSTFTLNISSLFNSFYQSARSTAGGSTFTGLRIPVSISGDKNAIGTVTVVLTNSVGASDPRSQSR